MKNESKGRKNVWGNWLTLAVLALTAASTEVQRRPPVIGRHLPDPGPNRIEVRFAIGEKAVECKRFRITARVEGRVIMAGKYASGFEIPADAMTLPRKDALKLAFKCGNNRWHFSKVPETAFQPGWWWVGTDYPPFQETLEG